MKVCIVEDEKLLQKELKQQLLVHEEIEVVRCIQTVEEGIDWLRDHATNIDLIFMDIELADGVCFEIFEAIDLTTPIIFLTAYSEYAIRAFKVNSIDYLLKPINPKELALALTKFKSAQEETSNGYMNLSVLKSLYAKSDGLLHNMLPADVINDLKENGKSTPTKHDCVTILFSDFEGFTELVASISAITLFNELNDIFGRFDEIMEETHVEKIETIGDAYMAACGLNESISDHAAHCITAAQKMLSYLEERNKTHEIKWKMRVGVHSGAVVAGVVGKKKVSYDLFGDTINTASRIESAGEPGKINISASTYELVKNDVPCISRGKIFAKGKGELDMYFVK